MPNRFTEELDALVPSRLDEYIYWSHLNKILPIELTAELSNFREHFASVEHFEPIKVLILCFIAEMSDEDLMEVFGS